MCMQVFYESAAASHILIMRHKSEKLAQTAELCSRRNSLNDDNFNDMNNTQNNDVDLHFPTTMNNGEAAHMATPMEKYPSRPHVWAILFVKTLGSSLVLMYFILPIFLRLNPWVFNELTFLHRIACPPFLTFPIDQPQKFGLNFTRHFKIQTSDGVALGDWHELPEDLETEPRLADHIFPDLLASGHPVLLYFHGNAGTRSGLHRVRSYQLLSSLGFHVIAFDYRGFADSNGSPSEEGVLQDGISVYKWALEQGSSSVYIWGHSLGTAIATKVAREINAQGLPLKGLILGAPFNNIIDAYCNHPMSRPFVMMPWYTWAVIEGLKTQHIYFTTEITISEVTVPTLILHAQDDGIIPYELGQKLYKAALENKRRGGVEFRGFDRARGYGHRFTHKVPELPDIIRKFVARKQ